MFRCPHKLNLKEKELKRVLQRKKNEIIIKYKKTEIFLGNYFVWQMWKNVI